MLKLIKAEASAIRRKKKFGGQVRIHTGAITRGENCKKRIEINAGTGPCTGMIFSKSLDRKNDIKVHQKGGGR